jgi:hypothetical protein
MSNKTVIEAKLILADLLAPHLMFIEGMMRGRGGPWDKMTFSEQMRLDAAIDAVWRAKQAYDLGLNDVAPSLTFDPDPTFLRSWFGGRLVFAYTKDRGRSLSLSILGLLLCLGFDRVDAQAEPSLGATGEMCATSRCLGFDLDMTIWRFIPWMHASLSISL